MLQESCHGHDADFLNYNDASSKLTTSGLPCMCTELAQSCVHKSWYEGLRQSFTCNASGALSARLPAYDIVQWHMRLHDDWLRMRPFHLYLGKEGFELGLWALIEVGR